MKSKPGLKLSALPRIGCIVLLCLGFCANLLAQEPEVKSDNTKYFFNIRTHDIGQALTEFALKTDYEIIVAADLLRGKRTEGVSGEYTEYEAINLLLDGTGLNYQLRAPKVMLICVSKQAQVRERLDAESRIKLAAKVAYCDPTKVSPASGRISR